MNAQPNHRSELARTRHTPRRSPIRSSDRVLRSTTLRRLNEALAGEVVCVIRYTRHHLMACGLHARVLAEECLSHALSEQVHADRLAERIVQLGGRPEFSSVPVIPAALSSFDRGDSLMEMMREDLQAEQVVIKRYRGFIDYLGDQDPDTRRLLEDILRMEQAHATTLGALLDQV